MRRALPLTITLCLVILPIAAIAATVHQQAAPCDQSTDPTACFDGSLFPATLVGDFYLDGNLVAAAVNSARLSGAPTAPHLVEVKNIQDPNTPGWNDLFVYPDQSRADLRTSAGSVRTVSFYPIPNYVKGVLSLTCSPRGYQKADVVACRPTIDGATQPDVAAGTTATYTLTPGLHAVHTELVGDQANNWSPTIRDDAVAIYTGRSHPQTTYLAAWFTPKGLLKISLQANSGVADLYVDGALVATQSATAEIYVNAGTHIVEARAISDPAANGLYVWSDVSLPTTAYAATTRNVHLYPKKTWLFGFLNLTCRIRNKSAGDDVYCMVKADGADLGQVMAAQSATYNLTPGAHTVTVSTGGAQAANWSGPVSTVLNITAGRSAWQTASFSRTQVAASNQAGQGLYRSGLISRNQTWSGTVNVTGDIRVNPDVTLTILPGTRVVVSSLSDDQHSGAAWEDNYIAGHGDPTRTEAWAQHAVIISVRGTMNALGTPEQPITFTTSGSSTSAAQWQGLEVSHGRLEYVLVENAKIGVNLQGPVVISHCTARNNLWVGLDIHGPNAQVSFNTVEGGGHHGIGVGWDASNALVDGNTVARALSGIHIEGGPATVRYNRLVDNNMAIAVMTGPGVEIANNVIEWQGSEPDGWYYQGTRIYYPIGPKAGIVGPAVDSASIHDNVGP